MIELKPDSSAACAISTSFSNSCSGADAGVVEVRQVQVQRDGSAHAGTVALSAGALLGDERHEAHGVVLRLVDAVAAPPHQRQPLMAAVDRQHEPAAVGERLDERRGHAVAAAGGDVDRVVRRPLRVAARAVADDELDVVDPGRCQRLGGRARQHGVALDRDDVAREPRQHGSVVAGAGADVEHVLVAVELEQLAHARDDRRLRDRLPVADRQRRVGPRLAAQAVRHEQVARDGGDRVQDAPVGDVRRQLLDQPLAAHSDPTSASS